MPLLPIGSTYDNATLVHSSGAKTATFVGEVSAAAKILDVGAGVLAAAAVVDVAALDTVTGDEKYIIHVQGSNSASFASGNIGLAQKEIGGASALLAATLSGVGRYFVPFINMGPDGTVYRYIRMNFVLSGNTPSITCTAFIGKIPGSD